MIEGVRTFLLTFMSLFYSPLTVDGVMNVVDDTISNTCYEAYPVLIFNDTRIVAVVCLLGLTIAIILGALLFLGYSWSLIFQFGDSKRQQRETIWSFATSSKMPLTPSRLHSTFSHHCHKLPLVC